MVFMNYLNQKDAIKIANLIAHYAAENYKQYYDSEAFGVNSVDKKLFSYLEKCSINSFMSYDCIAFLHQHGIFYHYKTARLSNLLSVYVARILAKSSTQENYVCEINQNKLNGIDFLESEVSDCPTVVIDVFFYDKLPKGVVYPKTIINRTGIVEIFQLAISDFGRISKNSWHYQDDPDGFPEKKCYLELYNYMQGKFDAEYLADKLIDELIDLENPRMHKTSFALEVYMNDM